MQTTTLHPTIKQLDGYFDTIRHWLQTLGGKGPRGIAVALSTADVENAELLDREQFETALNFAGVHLTANEVSSFMSHYGVGADPEMIRYKDFFMDLLKPLNGRREHAVEKAFQKLSGGTMQPIALDTLFSQYDVTKHPYVQSGEFSASEVHKQFEDHVALLNDSADSISYDVFCKYYLDISAAILSDELFIALVTKTWNVSESDHPLETDRVKYLREILLEKIRQKSKPKDIDSKNLLAICRFYDTGDKSSLTMREYDEVLHNFGMILDDKDLKLFFEYFMNETTHQIPFRDQEDSFIKKLYPPED